MIGALDAAEIEQLLSTEHIGRLGVYGDGRVYIVPVGFGYDGTHVFVHSSEGLKVRLMRAHPEVCFEVERVASPADWRTVIAHGTFEELIAPADRDAALAAIVSQGGAPYPPSVAPYEGGPEQLVVFQIRLSEKTGRYERDDVLSRG